MVIGNGMMARAFAMYRESEEVLIFASGVSDSSEKKQEEFMRERKVLMRALSENPGKLFIYFSTCSMYDPSMVNSQYVIHKVGMETLIKNNHSRYIIFRISQVVGENPNKETLIHKFYESILNGKKIFLWENAIRYIIDLIDVKMIVTSIIRTYENLNETINISSIPTNPLAIVEAFERVLHKNANYEILDRGAAYEIDNSRIRKVMSSNNIVFDDGYLENIIRKYYCSAQRGRNGG